MLDALIGKFQNYYGIAPVAAAQAPGRLEVLGNHTDYNEGVVLSCAVEQVTAFVMAPVTGTKCRIMDFRDGREMSFDLEDIDRPPPRGGSKYIIGMLRELRRFGLPAQAFCAALESNVPLSAGMSSSAALEVACGLAFSLAYDLGLENDPALLARAGQGVENNYLGLKSGLLDQFSSIFGVKDSLIMSDFRSVEVTDTLTLPAGYAFVVINSMKKHHLVDSDYNVRRQDCESAAMKLAGMFGETVKTLRDVSTEQIAAARANLSWREYRRAQHVIWECSRVNTAMRLIREGDIRSFGRLLFESHESSRLNFENSSPELDILIDIAKSTPGCLGARLSGGGFGGITIHLVRAEKAAQYAEKVCDAYKKQTGINADSFICAPGDGATGCLL
ncbi:MAG: galactokinase [Lentisphaeria bacterium]|nr:galactokinase [Lentisphaeria bacterium]